MPLEALPFRELLAKENEKKVLNHYCNHLERTYTRYMNNNDIWNETRRDYGVGATAEGARHFGRVTRPAERPSTPEAYVRAVIKALRWEHPKKYRECWYDWRLIAVGLNQVPPREFARHLPEWWKYWCEIAERPMTVGSGYNVDPPRAYAAFRIGWPASLVRRADKLCFSQLIAGRPTPGRLRRVSICLRAASRGSMRKFRADTGLTPSNKLLYALGRLCPELQKVALESVIIKYESGKRDTCLPKHVDWAAVAAAQKEMAENPAKRIRYASGQRRSTLFQELVPPEWREEAYRFSIDQIIGLIPLLTGDNPVTKENLWHDYRRWYHTSDPPPSEWEGEVIGWHYVSPDLTLNHDRCGETIGVGSITEHSGKIELCKMGLHASFSQADARRYAYTGWLPCKVRCSGRFVFGEDKFVCTRREILEIFPPLFKEEARAA